MPEWGNVRWNVPCAKPRQRLCGLRHQPRAFYRRRHSNPKHCGYGGRNIKWVIIHGPLNKVFSSFQSKRMRMLELRQQKRQALYRVSARRLGNDIVSKLPQLWPELDWRDGRLRRDVRQRWRLKAEFVSKKESSSVYLLDSFLFYRMLFFITDQLSVNRSRLYDALAGLVDGKATVSLPTVSLIYLLNNFSLVLPFE